MSRHEQTWASAKLKCSTFASENETQSLFDLLPPNSFFWTDTAKLMSLRIIAMNNQQLSRKKIFLKHCCILLIIADHKKLFLTWSEIIRHCEADEHRWSRQWANNKPGIIKKKKYFWKIPVYYWTFLTTQKNIKITDSKILLFNPLPGTAPLLCKHQVPYRRWAITNV